MDHNSEQPHQRRDSGGATIVQDKRVTNALQWFWTAIGTAAVAGVYWVANSITSLNVNLEKALVRMEYQDKRIDSLEGKVSQSQRDIAELQGKTFRGVQGYGEQGRGH